MARTFNKTQHSSKFMFKVLPYVNRAYRHMCAACKDPSCHHCVQVIFSPWVRDKRLLSLLSQYCDCIGDAGGVLGSHHRGLPKGGPLSMLIVTMLFDRYRSYKKTHNVLMLLRYLVNIPLLIKGKEK